MSTAAGAAALEALRAQRGEPSPVDDVPTPRSTKAAEREAQRQRDLAEHIRRVVDQAPPLSPAQRDRIAVLLRPVRKKP